MMLVLGTTPQAKCWNLFSTYSKPLDVTQSPAQPKAQSIML